MINYFTIDIVCEPLEAKPFILNIKFNGDSNVLHRLLNVMDSQNIQLINWTVLHFIKRYSVQSLPVSVPVSNNTNVQHSSLRSLLNGETKMMFKTKADAEKGKMKFEKILNKYARKENIRYADFKRLFG